MHPHVLNNETVWLIQPCHIGVKWTQANKHLRSVVVNEDGEIVSMGFSKFTNYGENPEHFPTPDSLKGCVCMEKIDGSLLIVSKYKGKFILRTRGTVDASKLDNGYELEYFKQKYVKVFEFFSEFEYWNFSLLFEWTTPNNRIVIRYGDEPEFSLVGGINHDTGKLWMQDALNAIANTWGCPRPKVYSFDSISDLLTLVDGWQGKEGVCVYSNLGQAIHKVKSADYLCKHRLKEEFCNFERVLDFYIAEGCPEFGDFQTRVSEVTDWETATELKKDISKLCDAWKEVLLISNHMKEFVKPLKLVSRKDAAQKIISSYGNSNRASFCFSILDGKELTKDQNKKLLWQVLKK
jgi:hypothetical protein